MKEHVVMLTQFDTYEVIRMPGLCAQDAEALGVLLRHIYPDCMVEIAFNGMRTMVPK